MSINKLLGTILAFSALSLFQSSVANAETGPQCATQVLSKACISIPLVGIPYDATFSDFSVGCDGFKVNTCRVLMNCLPCAAQYVRIKVVQGGPIGVGTTVMDFVARDLGDSVTANKCYGNPYHRGAATFPDSIKYGNKPLYFYAYVVEGQPKLIAGNVNLVCPIPTVVPTPTATQTPTPSPTATPAPIRITPIAECKTTNSNGTITAVFGYQNNSGFDANIPVGPLNNFNPGTSDLPLPTFFFQGRVAGVVRSTYLGTPSKWNLNGVGASAAATLPECLPNQRPIAVAAVSAPICQQNNTALVNLDASLTTDPDNKPNPLIFQWFSNCSNSTITNPSSAKTTMSISLVNGISQACTATVLVSDGLSTESAVAAVNAAQCGTGTCNPDSCGVCNGDGKSCLDCKGIPNGTTKVDSCGVCGGDGSTCDCSETDSNIDKIDALFHEQAISANRLAAILKRVAPNDKKVQAFVNTIVKDSNVTMTTAWATAWGNYSIKVTVCSGASSACTQADKAPNIQELADRALRLFNNAKKTFNQIKSKGKSRDVINARTRLQAAQKQYNQNASLIKSLPRFTSTCN